MQGKRPLMLLNMKLTRILIEILRPIKLFLKNLWQMKMLILLSLYLPQSYFKGPFERMFHSEMVQQLLALKIENIYFIWTEHKVCLHYLSLKDLKILATETSSYSRNHLLTNLIYFLLILNSEPLLRHFNLFITHLVC